MSIEYLIGGVVLMLVGASAVLFAKQWARFFRNFCQTVFGEKLARRVYPVWMFYVLGPAFVFIGIVLVVRFAIGRP